MFILDMDLPLTVGMGKNSFSLCNFLSPGYFPPTVSGVLLLFVFLFVSLFCFSNGSPVLSVSVLRNRFLPLWQSLPIITSLTHCQIEKLLPIIAAGIKLAWYPSCDCCWHSGDLPFSDPSKGCFSSSNFSHTDIDSTKVFKRLSFCFVLFFLFPYI